MKSLLLLLAVLPLAFCQTQKVKTACKCAHVECPAFEPDRCNCENRAAVQCAQLCGTVPQIKFCPFGGPRPSDTSPTTTPTPTAAPVPELQKCGYFVQVPCPSGSSCASNPATPLCEGCAGICVPTASSNLSSIEPTTVPSETSLTATATPLPGAQKCGAFVDTPCPPDQSCVTDPATPDCHDCSGICVPPQRCGSRGLKPCPEDRFCVNDPNDPSCSITFDCPGYCVLLDGNDCSAELDIACPSSQQVCVDDPSDDCFPGGVLLCPEKCTFLNGRSSAGFLEE